jgi:hypothetical protein
VVAIAGIMIFWLCRVLFTSKYKKKATASPLETVPASNLA